MRQIMREIETPWGRINFWFGIGLFGLTGSDIGGAITDFSLRVHWKFISLAFSIHGTDAAIVAALLPMLLVGYWMFCIRTFGQISSK